MSSSHSFRIHLSLVSHTNIGKTTLARTLLLRDVGDVADRAHVTETNDDYVLARDSAGCELILWDTPGFGNSVALARRLRARKNPLGWFLSEIWDRMTDRALWLNQRAMAHIRDTSDVVLYLVNASELPEQAPYIKAEMQILSWIGKPVIVLLNQMGRPKAPAEEHVDLQKWKAAMEPYDFVRDVLPMDAFARCWVQERALLDAIGEALSPAQQAAYASLRQLMQRTRLAMYEKSVDAMSRHVWALLRTHETVQTPTLKDHVLSFASQLGLSKTKNAAIEAARSALSAQAADNLCTLSRRLIEINHLKGRGVSKEILRRMKADWETATYSIDTTSAAALGAGVGVAGGAAAGAAADMGTAGLSMGLGTVVGGLLGALSGAGAATIYNARHHKEGIDLSWSDKAVRNFVLETLLLYLAVSHFGRGRGDWQAGESPEFWKTAASQAMDADPMDLPELKQADPENGPTYIAHMLDGYLRAIFKSLYGVDL